MNAVYTPPQEPLKAPAMPADANHVLSVITTGSLCAVLALSALFVLLAPGQPLAALLGVPTCVVGG